MACGKAYEGAPWPVREPPWPAREALSLGLIWGPFALQRGSLGLLGGPLGLQGPPPLDLTGGLFILPPLTYI